MDESNYFRELIRILHIEELLRLQRRCEMQNNWPLAELLGYEVAARDMIKQAEVYNYEND